MIQRPKAARSSTRNAISVARVKRETSVRFVEYHRMFPSTNTRALELAADPSTPIPALVITEIQTAGRGRGENVWWSAAGALTFSLILDLESQRANPESWPTFALATAVTVCDVLEARAPMTRFGIRWPNDVYCGTRKICGILPEIYTKGPLRLVLGIGLNVNNAMQQAPVVLRETAISLLDLTGERWNLTETLVFLLKALEGRIDDPHVPAAWSERCLLRGHDVTVGLESRECSGFCTGIDEAGALTLRMGDTVERFFGGTILRVSD